MYLQKLSAKLSSFGHFYSFAVAVAAADWKTMGAVRWTWSELADMHLCLGAARAAGGDAEEAKRLYEENHPDRGVPEQGVFIAVDLSLRATGQLL